MSIEELQKLIEERQRYLAANEGKGVNFSPNGPPSMDLIHALAAVLERQEREIAALQAKVK